MAAYGQALADPRVQLDDRRRAEVAAAVGTARYARTLRDARAVFAALRAGPVGQALRQKLLASLDELRLLATGVGRPPATKDSWGKWVSGFNYLLGGVRLFGGQSVIDAAEALYGMTFALNDELTKQLAAGSDYGDGLFQALLVLDDDLNVARKALIDAMRADVALRP